MYIREGVEFRSIHTLAEPNIQLLKIQMAKLDLVTVYRSSAENESRAAQLLTDFINPEKDTLVLGDLNYCARKEKKELGKFFAREGFTQLVTLPTHIGGGILKNFHLFVIL